MEHNPISENRWVSVSNSEHRWVGKEKCCIFALWFRKSLSQICTDTLVASNGLIHIKSHSKENLWKSVLSVGKLNIKHSTLIINKNEKGNNSESNQFRHHRPHCRPQFLLCAELQVIAFEHESNESICSMDIFVSFLPTLALQPRRNLWKTSSTVSPSTITMPRF